MKNMKEILEVSRYIVKNNATISDVEEKFHIKKAQIFKYISELKKHSKNNKDIKELYEAVKRSLKNYKTEMLKHFVFPDLYFEEEKEENKIRK